MQVKVFKFDKTGKVSFTQEELEKLLNEVYNGGYWDGKRSNNYWTWTSPWYSNSTYYTTTNTDLNVSTAKNTEQKPHITWTASTNGLDDYTTVKMETGYQDTEAHIY